MSQRKIVIGSRESRLAVIQSEMVKTYIEEQNKDCRVELLTMKTTGDKILDRTLDKVGGKGLFVKELDRALEDGRTMLSVHSLKDMPMEVSEEPPLIAFSKRQDPRDVLVLPEGVDALDPEKMFESIAGDMNGTVMPGWEPERMEHVKELFEMYKDIDDEKLFENLKYFLERIMPVCDEYDINMAIHPDDPAWSVFGLPRIIINKENILRMMKMVDNPHNGVTFCSGSYGTNLENDLPDMIRSLKGRIHFAHVRNLKFITPTNFEEAAHLSSDGTFDMYEIMKALYDIGFTGPIRPDHGRMIWDEVAMPGYGLYDRALGATYLNGLWEAIEKGEKRA